MISRPASDFGTRLCVRVRVPVLGWVVPGAFVPVLSSEKPIAICELTPNPKPKDGFVGVWR